jgi:hypothetical protein
VVTTRLMAQFLDVAATVEVVEAVGEAEAWSRVQH